LGGQRKDFEKRGLEKKGGKHEKKGKKSFVHLYHLLQHVTGGKFDWETGEQESKHERHYEYFQPKKKHNKKHQKKKKKKKKKKTRTPKNLTQYLTKKVHKGNVSDE